MTHIVDEKQRRGAEEGLECTMATKRISIPYLKRLALNTQVALCNMSRGHIGVHNNRVMAYK
jgi:hypothetical protein